ncbi:hypothetical protein BH23GEM4_BH23GEM4_19430 [soil metagenome]
MERAERRGGYPARFTFLVKGLAGRERPYVDIDNPFDFKLARGFGDGRFRSFPSWHTVAAFAAAAALTSELSREDSDAKWLVGPLLYGGATLVGASRLYGGGPALL